jgi:hypothetical protein
VTGKPERKTEENERRNPPRRRKPAVVVRIFRAFLRHKNSLRRQRQKEETPHQINERRIASWTARVGWFTAALVAVSIVTALIFQGQLNVMQGQLDAMKRDQAPYIYVVLENPGAPELKAVDRENSATRIIWMSVIANAGKGLAVNVIVDHFMRVGSAPFKLTGGATGPLFAGDMPVGANNHLFTVSDDIDRAEYERLLGVPNGISLLLEFQYRDTAGGTYESAVCLGRSAIAQKVSLLNPDDCKKAKEH